jgi:hypothetical protein
MMSSVMPSLKYSCRGSPLRLAKASTAMEGRSASDVMAKAPGPSATCVRVPENISHAFARFRSGSKGFLLINGSARISDHALDRVR